LEGVSFHRRGAARTLPADTLLLHQGVVPQLNLAMSAGCAHRWHSGRVAFEPVVDAWFESSIPGLHVVGDGAGIGGADAAVFRGRLAALATAARLGSVDLGTRDRLGAGQRSLAQKAMRGRRFLDLLFKPAVEFRVPADSTIVCRCEDVTAGAVRSAVACGAQGPNQVKAFVRAGMGPCQARQCGLTVCETIADARGLAPGDIGHVHLRNPVKPITVGDLAGLSRSGDPKSGSHRLF
jgi:NADPH-dependent 2,4-dienoyl-CoA reductase/sulfur reductase-like enzyme